jgi:large subunit ribosomal protein L24
MKIHTGDTVLVISGKDKGKQGTVMRVLPHKQRVVIESINMRVRHIRKTAQEAGQRIKYEASIHVSNVMLLDPKTKKPTRVGYKVDPKTGNKSRVARVSGEALPLVAKTKAVAPKKGTKGTKGTKEEKEKHDENKPEAEQAAEVKTQGPKKQPFWKRAFTADEMKEGGGETRNRQEEIDKNSPSSVRRSRESS